MSDYIVWDEKYELGIPSIDAEHQRIFQLLNQSFSAKQKGHGPEVVDPFLEELIDYAMSHFAHEEALLLKYQYPQFEGHRRDHRNYVKKVSNMQEDTLVDQGTRFIRLCDFLKEWWLNHIQMEDRDYSEFLKGKGVK